jgi:hypothetical protein
MPWSGHQKMSQEATVLVPVLQWLSDDTGQGMPFHLLVCKVRE